MNKYIINENDSGQRVDRFIQKVLPELPKSMMYRLIRKKDIKVNGKRCSFSDRLKTGDSVSVYIRDEFTGTKKDELSFMKASENINIVYEDENIIIVNKEAGVTVHCDQEHETDTLVNRIKLYLYKNGNYLPDAENSFSPALCSRLDRNTSGLVTAAKNAAALRELNEAIREGGAEKIYRCLTVGTPPNKSGILTAYHYKEPTGNIVKISQNPLENYRPIKTGYKVAAEKPPLCLLEVTLYTGRTHQIRAHLASVGMPVLGDCKYGNMAANRKYGIFMQTLCAYSLTYHFKSGSCLEYLNSKTFTAPKPEFEKLLKATPHRDCAEDAPSDFSSDCIKMRQAY